MQSNTPEQYLKIWNSNEIKNLRDKIVNFLAGKKRFEKLILTRDPKNLDKMWITYGELREDNYPLVGGKHKQWYIKAMCMNRNGQFQEKEFYSKVGYNQEIETIWQEVKGWLMLNTGDSTINF